MKTHNNPRLAQSKTHFDNPESGQEVAKQSGQARRVGPNAKQGRSSDEKSDALTPALPRSHAGHWKARLFRPTYTRDGIHCEVNDLAVRIQHGGRRQTFTLGTTNQEAAAIKARDLYLTVKGAGWDAALAKFKPDTQSDPKLDVTLGDYLSAVSALGCLRSRTFLNYQNCLRTITAEIFSIRPDKGTSKYDYRSQNNGHALWIAKIDARRLEDITLDRINHWKLQRIARAKTSPVAIASAKRSINSYIRCSRSLFAPAIVKLLAGKLTLPSPLPFAGVELEENGSQKYTSKINAQTLIAAARSELKSNDPEAYKAFLLGLFAGMRKAEIDLVEWRMVNFATATINLEQTEWLHLKTDDSAAEIAVDPEVLTELRTLMPQPSTTPAPWSQFILSSQRPPKPESPRPYYRCEDSFNRLSEWLRSKGITANKPLHELRKELGALIASEHGIYAASRFLRHSDISTTARHYADQKTRISVGLGAFLDTNLKALPESPAANP